MGNIIWDGLNTMCCKLGTWLQPIEKYILKNIIRANTASGYILMFIVIIIWFSFNAFLCYSCYIGWIFSDSIRDTWAPFMNDQDVLNQLCDNQWDDKFTYGAYCDDSPDIEDCATIRTPEDNARIMYDTDIAYLFFIILGTLSSITVFILQRRTESADNLRSLPMLHC